MTVVVSEGVVFYVISSTAVVAWQHFQGNLSSDRDEASYQTPPSSMTRCDSEFSLGLGRSDSISKELSELGPMCNSGKLALQFTKYILLSVAGIYVMTRLSKKS